MRVFLLLGFLSCTSLALAQNSPQSPSLDGTIHTRVEGINIAPIPGAPFSAKVLVTWDQPLIGGGSVSHDYYTMVARDSAGRVHRETRDFVPATSNTDPPLRTFTITDPARADQITCTQATLTCTVIDFRTTVALTQLATGQSATTPRKGFSRQDLGSQVMQALSVTGTRETTTSNLGSGGNSRLVVSSRDLWLSPDLQMCLSVVRNDPQLGRIALTVTELQRGEPDPSWFTIPAGFIAVDARRNRSGAN